MSHSELDIAREAKGLREQLGYDQLTPIGDIKQMVKETGHQLTQESFGNQFSAACIYQGREQFLIVLNKDQMWNERFKRFTIAHEFGHISLKQHLAEMERNGGKLQTVAEFRSDKRIEREADLFAVHFLAPTTLFYKLSQYKEFNKSSLKEIAEDLNISLMATAYRFVSLTDLACSLIIIDNSTSKVRFEFRSKAFKDLGYLTFISSSDVPAETLTYEVMNGLDNANDEMVLLNDWYPNLKNDVRCNESVFRLGYNDTTVTMLSITDDPEELEEFIK